MTDVRTIIARQIADEEYREDPVTLDYAVADRILRALTEASIKPLAREPTEVMVAAMTKTADEMWRLTAPLHQVDDAETFRAAWDAA